MSNVIYGNITKNYLDNLLKEEINNNSNRNNIYINKFNAILKVLVKIKYFLNHGTKNNNELEQVELSQFYESLKKKFIKLKNRMIELNLLPSENPSNIFTNNMYMDIYNKNMSMQIYTKNMNIESFLDSLVNKLGKNKKNLNSSSRKSLSNNTNSNSLKSLRDTKILKKNTKIDNYLNGILASPGTIGSNYQENNMKFFKITLFPKSRFPRNVTRYTPPHPASPVTSPFLIKIKCIVTTHRLTCTNAGDGLNICWRGNKQHILEI